MRTAEDIARIFHETHEKLATKYLYMVSADSEMPWEEVPEQNRNLMTATVQQLLDDGIIVMGTEDKT